MKVSDLLLLFRKSSKFAIFFVLLISLASVYYSFGLKNQYTSTAILTSAQKLDSNNIQSNSLGSIGMLAGINTSNIGSPEHIASLSFRSRDFFKVLYEDNNFLVNLMAVSENDSNQYNLAIDESIYNSDKDLWLENTLYKKNKPTLQQAHKQFLKQFGIKKIDKDQIHEVSFTSYSSPNSKKVLDFIIKSMNEYIRIKDQKNAKDNLKFLEELSIKTNNADSKYLISKLIEKELTTLMLSNSSDSYVFDIVESPHEPEIKSKPSRVIFCISAFFISLFISLLIIFVTGSFNKKIALSFVPPRIYFTVIK